MKPKKNIFQIFLNIFSWIFLGAFIVVIIFTAVSNLDVFGGYKSLIVQSGSMEPTIMTGDVIIIGQAQNYQVNDVVTFTDTDGYITTHRIDQITNTETQLHFTTKGDANRIQDSETIAKDQILGKVIFSIPKLGFFISFVRSKNGVIIFVLLPAFLITIDEVIKIINTVKKKKNVS